MYTLPDQVEFLSDEWLAAARGFLEREVPLRKGRLAGPFSVSERFTDAPPHLGLPGDAGGWSMRFDGEAVSVSREPDPGADLVVEGDYQAALTAAQRVGITGRGAAEAMWREGVQQFGKDAVRFKGRLADPPAAELLALLHDHLGRRTVENPDLRHRAARQGLLGKIVEMEEQGYTVLEGAISPEFADEVREETQRVLAEQGVWSLQWMLYQGRCFELLAQ